MLLQWISRDHDSDRNRDRDNDRDHNRDRDNDRNRDHDRDRLLGLRWDAGWKRVWDWLFIFLQDALLK